MIEVKDNWIILDGRRCGRIEEDKYVTKRIAEKHYYIMGSGYPIANEILHWLKEHGIKTIVVIEQGRKKTRKFTTTVVNYYGAVMIRHPPFEQQRCLPLKEMEEINK